MRLLVAVARGRHLCRAGLAQTPARTLQIYYVDTEGGQSTLFVTPSVSRCSSTWAIPADATPIASCWPSKTLA